MKNTQADYTETSSENWQLLGELKLSLDSVSESAIIPWLMELLSPLDLSTDFMNRVLESAQGSAMRIMEQNAAIAFGHAHLSIYAPYDHISERKSWGFFHIERIEYLGDALDARRHHAIDFYLYVEGR